MSYKSYKEICSGEPKKVNLGYWGDWMAGGGGFKVENNLLVHIPRTLKYIIYTVIILVWLRNGKFSPSFSQITTLNLSGWTVTTSPVTMTRNWEGGLAVWDRFEGLNIEC